MRYATRNGTAKKGKDYGKAKGTLAFAAGETSKTVSVAILDDAHDEGAETFRLVLYQAKGAAIADGEAVGTIENSDPLQQDWLARFGRAAASDAVAAVTARLETPRDAGSHLTLAGQRLSLDGSRPAAGTGGRSRRRVLAVMVRRAGRRVPVAHDERPRAAARHLVPFGARGRRGPAVDELGPGRLGVRSSPAPVRVCSA